MSDKPADRDIGLLAALLAHVAPGIAQAGAEIVPGVASGQLGQAVIGGALGP